MSAGEEVDYSSEESPLILRNHALAPLLEGWGDARDRMVRDDAKTRLLTMRNHRLFFVLASVRAAITSASSNKADASRNGAPGNFSGACAPMK